MTTENPQTAAPQDSDEKFFERADAHIQLANEQLKATQPGRAGASMMFAAARFSSWLVAGRFMSAEGMRKGKPEAIQHFVQQFQKMLEDNLEDHIRQFEKQGKK